jgi:hypothetical protein
VLELLDAPPVPAELLDSELEEPVVVVVEEVVAGFVSFPQPESPARAKSASPSRVFISISPSIHLSIRNLNELT